MRAVDLSVATTPVPVNMMYVSQVGYIVLLTRWAHVGDAVNGRATNHPIYMFEAQLVGHLGAKVAPTLAGWM